MTQRAPEPDIRLATTDAGISLSRIQRRVLITALGLYVADQRQRIADAPPAHAKARELYLRAATEMLGFIVSAGLYVKPEQRRALGIADDRNDPLNRRHA